jgi:hypothetical protein
VTADADDELPTRASRRQRERGQAGDTGEVAPTEALPTGGAAGGPHSTSAPDSTSAPGPASAADDGPATQVFAWDLESGWFADEHETGQPDTEPTPVDPSLEGAPSFDPQPPTEAMSWETAVVPEVAAGGPVPRHPVSPVAGSADGTGGSQSALDALFEPGQFRDFEPEPLVPRELPPGATAVIRAAHNRPSLTSGQRSLLWAACALVAILVLIALFAIGRRLPAMFAGPVPVETSAPTATPTKEPVDTTAGPLKPGEYAWDELRGGECLEPYVSAWEEDYTVVACDGPHGGQLVFRGQFSDEVAPDGAFPGFDELTAQINRLCTRPKVLDYGAAGKYDDIVVEGAHAVTAEDWDAGNTGYFCFLTRSGGDPLEGTLAVPREG